jgi:SAM-dependent methyltransferase
MRPAPPDRCRVLEVGCGDGANLVPMAYCLPASEFTGIDFAGDAIEAARALAGRADVANVRFETLDLTKLPASAGTFDYIIAHGVYSWIAADVRDALIALIGRHLAPQGVAFVSYNTLPGCRQRQMMWDMLKFHTGELDDPQARMSEAQTLIRLIAHGSVQPDQYTSPIVDEAKRMESRPPWLLFHDDLSPVNEPVYFHEFVEHAAGHGLQFVAEASMVASSYSGIAAEARRVLATLDPITRQQYLDFIRCRRFRQSLVCRDEVSLERDEIPDRIRTLSFTGARSVRFQPPEGATQPVTAETSAAANDSDVAVVNAVLEVVRAAAPRALPFAATIERLRARPDFGPLLAACKADEESILLAAVQTGVIEPHVVAPPLAFPPGDRPAASAVARAELERGGLVTSMWHQAINVDDEISRRLLPLLDGTRDRDALLVAMGDLVGSGASGAATLDEHLLRLARLALLIA